MSYFSKRILAATLAGTILISGCTTTNSTPINTANMTPTEIALRQQQTERKRIYTGVATGAVVGALAGAAIGALAGNDSKDIARGAVIGGVGGGVIGGMDANRVNQNTRTIAAQQDNLRQVIASADQNIAYYRKTTALTQKLANEDAARLQNSKKQLASGQITKAAYQKEVSGAKANIQLVDQYVKNADQDINDLRRAGGNNAATQQRVAQLTNERNQLKNQLSRMQTAVSRAG